MQKIYQKNNDATKIKSGISGCYLLNLTKNIDQRGYFFNILSKNLFFNKYSLTSIKQINISENKKHFAMLSKVNNSVYLKFLKNIFIFYNLW